MPRETAATLNPPDEPHSDRMPWINESSSGVNRTPSARLDVGKAETTEAAAERASRELKRTMVGCVSSSTSTSFYTPIAVNFLTWIFGSALRRSASHLPA